MNPYSSTQAMPPPPSYGSLYNHPTQTTPLYPNGGSERKKRNSQKWVVYGLLLLLTFLFVSQNCGYMPTMADDISPQEKALIKEKWQLETRLHKKEVIQWARERNDHKEEVRGWEREREEWQGERNAFEREREGWQNERDAFEREREGWARERQDEERHRKEIERRRQGVHWDGPWVPWQCHGYGTRAYSAHLLDIPGDLNWLEVCSDMPIMFHGQLVDKPDRCERNEHSVWATWFINFGEPQCVTYWDPLRDLGCSPGQTGMRRFESRLMNLRHGDDWDLMCRTTPANIHGVHFDRPTTCEDKNGRTGVWDVPDSRCG